MMTKTKETIMTTTKMTDNLAYLIKIDHAMYSDLLAIVKLEWVYKEAKWNYEMADMDEDAIYIRTYNEKMADVIKGIVMGWEKWGKK